MNKTPKCDTFFKSPKTEAEIRQFAESLERETEAGYSAKTAMSDLAAIAADEDTGMLYERIEQYRKETKS